ncbi:MAG TPA: Fic family protein [Anaeromyxobacteraceae bacterium]|nr:Fic family protein [Anaeromyxobacteraceae bacterium]
MARTVGETRRSTVAGETVAAFVPGPLPPSDPPLALDPVRDVLSRAEHALSRLDLASDMVPSLDWFTYAFVRKEAVVSSQIEGTEATLDDLLTFEAKAEGTKPGADVEEVCNYLDALAWARRELARPKGLPLSMRLVHGVHRRLMKGVRGASKQPGEVRRSQNWVGGTRPSNAAYVPPPPEEVPRLLGELERYIHAEDLLPPLVRAGLVHVQFESIHPYLDGNGRVGRLLIALLLEHWKLLGAPLLYLSLHFKRRRPEYYRLLDEVRRTGDWEAWSRFFLEGVAEIAEESATGARDLYRLVACDRERVLVAKGSSLTAARLLELLPRRPVVTIPGVVKMLETTKPTATKSIELFETLGILQETTGRKRDRMYRYTRYLELLRAGTELAGPGGRTAT